MTIMFVTFITLQFVTYNLPDDGGRGESVGKKEAHTRNSVNVFDEVHNTLDILYWT